MAKDSMQSYVLDEYRDILFPKKQSKFAMDHQRALALKAEEEAADAIETRRKMMALADMMSYDDDFEESRVNIEREKKAAQPAVPVKKEKKVEESDDEEDELVDSAALFIERTNSQRDETAVNLLEEDPKLARARMAREAREAEANAPKRAAHKHAEEESKDNGGRGKRERREREPREPREDRGDREDRRGGRRGGRGGRDGRDNNQSYGSDAAYARPSVFEKDSDEDKEPVDWSRP